MRVLLEDYINTDQHGQCCNDGHGRGIALQGSFYRDRARTSLVLLQSKSSESCSLTRVASRRISWSKRSTVIYSDTSDFRGMNRSGVVPARSWSSKGIYGLGRTPVEGKRDRFIDANGHRVSNVDGDDISPWNRDLVERIDDRQTFIEDDHFRAHEYGKGDGREQGGPEQSRHSTLNGEVSEALVGVNRRGNDGDGREDRTTSRSEGHRISHAVIISRRDAR